jgi:23S rRNA pseudouridine1911/1915/1917 synthase
VARLVVTVADGDAGARLDRFLATLPEVGTRARGRQWIDAGRVLVDGTPRKPATELRAGMRVEIDVVPPEVTSVEAQDIALAVLYEDADLLVIDKPAGMVVHPAPGARRDTVVNALLHRFGTMPAVGESERPGIVHRLDRDTSGVLAIARTALALDALGRQFRERSVQKQYLGIAHGTPRARAGRIALPVGRDPRARKRMSTASRRGRVALTTYAVEERLAGAVLLRLSPHTGRTHQLRVHLQALGHPLVGDRVYGGGRRAVRGTPAAAAEAIAAFPRQALHAVSLALAHPRTGAPLRFDAPLPADMAELLRVLRAGA